jgi:glucosamine-6-phosphate deaminase
MTGTMQAVEFGSLPVEVYPDAQALGRAAAERAAALLRAALVETGQAHLIVATGNSQLAFLAALRQQPGIAWSRVHVYHMDEYVGIAADHPASFRRYLREKFVDHVHPASFHGVEGDAPDPEQECRRYAALLQTKQVALTCLGIGENGHLAFNDPPFANFADPARVKVVTLDEASRRQQVGEGHFPSLADVPRQAITLTIPALLSAGHVLAIVPERRKAEAVRAALTGPITTQCPASILRTAAHARLYLDQESCSLVPLPAHAPQVGAEAA